LRQRIEDIYGHLREINRQRFWHDHITAWQASDLTQKTYCQAQNLRYASFGYWVRKLRERSQDQSRQGSGFVPMTLSPTAEGLVLAVPNGLEIRGIEKDRRGIEDTQISSARV